MASYWAVKCVAQAMQVIGTTRSADKRAPDGVQLLHPDDKEVRTQLEQAEFVLVSVPPGEGHRQMVALCQSASLSHVQWLGYLSSTGVYGDHAGAWVDETSICKPFDVRTQVRLDAEHDWLALDAPSHIFRLSGIYGPDRNSLASVRAGTARRIIKPGHYFSRIHVDDIVSILWASMQQPAIGEIYNVADDMPSASHEPLDYAAKRLGVEPPTAIPFEQAELSPMMQSFYAANRRISNQKIKEALGIKLAYPSYKEGLSALLKELAV